MIEIFTSPTCLKCHVLKASLNEKGIVFTEIDISTDEGYFKAVENNVMSVPVVLKDGIRVSPEEII